MSETTFGDWLKRERKRRRLSQEALALQVGKHRTHLNRIETGAIGLPDEDTRARIHMALGTTEDDLVAVGILERIESVEPGGEPVYIAAESVTPGERQAERAHRIHEGRQVSYAPDDDPRAQLAALLAGASDDDVRKVVQVVTILLGGIAATRQADGDARASAS